MFSSARSITHLRSAVKVKDSKGGTKHERDYGSDPANMTNATKDALEAAGFPAYTCTKVRGRGKKPFNFAGEITGNTRHRLLPKRLIALIAADDQADKIVEVMMKTNH